MTLKSVFACLFGNKKDENIGIKLIFRKSNLPKGYVFALRFYLHKCLVCTRDYAKALTVADFL